MRTQTVSMPQKNRTIMPGLMHEVHQYFLAKKFGKTFYQYREKMVGLDDEHTKRHCHAKSFVKVKYVSCLVC